MGPRLLISASLFLMAAQAPAGEVVETAAQWYASYELLQGGDSFYGRFLEFGWPTDEAHQQLTRAYAGRPAAEVISALLASGAGQPLSATRELKGEGGKGGAKVSQILARYRSLAGLSASLPAAFEPTCIPALRSRQQLARAYRANDLGTWRWVEAPKQYALEGLGFSLLGEVAFAREILLKEDPSPDEHFFAYLALHSALAKTSELRHLIYDSRRQRISPVGEEDLLQIDEHRYHFANSWTSAKGSSGFLEHKLAEGDIHRRSYLRAQSALLLGLCNLLSLTDPDRLKSGPKHPALTPKHHQRVLQLTLFAFKMLRAHHIDVRAGKARSSSKSAQSAPIDVGLCLLSLEAFLKYVNAGKNERTLKPVIEGERRKARTLVSRLGQQVREWCESGEGLYDSYELTSNRRIDRTKSVASQAMAARGLLAAHRVLNPGSSEGPLLQAVHTLLIWLDDDRWNPKAQLYADEKLGKSVEVFGVASTLGVLREMALELKDGHYLLRYRQLLRGAHKAGLFTPPSNRDPAGLAPKLGVSGG